MSDTKQNKAQKSPKKDDPFSALEKSFKKRGLGRGLEALFEDEEATYPQFSPQEQAPQKQRRMIAISQISPGAYQPRTIFDENALAELAASMKEHGVLQPLLVRVKKLDGKINAEEFEIIAGERRWRAAQKAGIHEIPVIIREFSDKAALEIGLIENLQREDLNPLDEARALKQLMDEFEYTQQEAAESMGKSRPYVANMVRLMSLPIEVRDYIERGELTAGHARTLITADNPLELAREIVAKNLSVRATEALSKSKKKPSQSPKKAKPQKDVNTIALENEVSDALGMVVSIDMVNNKQGTLNVAFKNLDQLDELIKKLTLRS